MSLGDSEVGLPQALAGGDADPYGTERASAMPQAAHLAKGKAPTTGDATSASLHDIQRWFLTVITNPDSVDRGLRDARKLITTGAVVRDSPQLAASACLGVYHYAYHARLIECLADDFTCVQHYLGEEGFARLARAYIAATPSRHPNLNGYGQQFPQWLRQLRRPLEHRAFLAELALLEWSLVEIIHAEAAPVLDADALAAIPSEEWGDLRLQPAATLRLLTFRHPVNAAYQAWRDDTAIAVPKAASTAVAVYRSGFRLYRMDLSPLTHALLRDLFEGRTLGEAMERCAKRGVAVPDLVPRVMEWFSSWVSGGFFAAIH